MNFTFFLSGLLLNLTQPTESKTSVDHDSAFEFHESESDAERGKPPEERINLSVPGTKWCGPGSTAEDYDDLGQRSEEDKCCRAHGMRLSQFFSYYYYMIKTKNFQIIVTQFRRVKVNLD